MANQIPLVSIILPTLNSSRYISIAIESCLKQTFQDFELLIVDGGSKDNTLSIVDSFNDNRIHVIHQPANTGRLPGALNLGFEHASGTFFTWFQDDDIYSPEAIEVLAKALIKTDSTGLVYSGFWFINESGQVIRDSEISSPEDISWTNPVGHCFLYRRQVAEIIGNYNENWFMVEDFEYWARIFKIFPMAMISTRHYFHRLHSNSLTISNYGGYLALRLAAKVRREMLGINYKKYLSQISDAYIQEGFAAYINSEESYSKKCFINGVIRNPFWLSNRGVLSILFKSKRYDK